MSEGQKRELGCSYLLRWHENGREGGFHRIWGVNHICRDVREKG